MKSRYWTFVPIEVTVDSDGMLHLASVDFDYELAEEHCAVFTGRELARDYLTAAIHHYES